MWINLILFAILIIASEGVEEITLVDDQEFLLECTYEENCSTDTIFKTAEKHQLLVTVKTVDINGGNGDFLLIKSGTEIDDGLSGRIFTHHINHERTYISVTNDLLVRFYINPGTEQTRTFAGFVLTVQRIDQQEDTSTEPSAPPSYDSRLYNITVNVEILILPINETFEIFKSTVAEMAQEFVNTTNLILAEIISPQDVDIIKVMKCPLQWPRRDTCFQIVFALPVVLAEDSDCYSTHQLSRNHLNQMWKTAPSYFNRENTTYIIFYDDHKRNFLIPWLAAIVSVTVLFAILYMLMGDLCSKKIREKMLVKKKVELVEKPQTDPNKADLIIFGPHPFQTVPPLFDSDVTYYSPDDKTFIHEVHVRPRDSIDEGLINSSNMNFFETENNASRRETTSRKNYDVLP